MEGHGEKHGDGAGPARQRFSSLEQVQRAHVRKVLEMTHHDLSATALLLEVELAELRRLMKRLGIA